MYKITKYLTDTVLNMEHTRAQEMKDLLSEAAKSKGGELVTMFLADKGVAVIEVKGDDAQKHIKEELGKLTGVEVSEISAFQVQYERNKALQQKVDKKRANKKEKVKVGS